eukprot:scaffold241_cov340-Pavlova_lutheri.AAC.35
MLRVPCACSSIAWAILAIRQQQARLSHRQTRHHVAEAGFHDEWERRVLPRHGVESKAVPESRSAWDGRQVHRMVGRQLRLGGTHQLLRHALLATFRDHDQAGQLHVPFAADHLQASHAFVLGVDGQQESVHEKRCARIHLLVEHPLPHPTPIRGGSWTNAHVLLVGDEAEGTHACDATSRREGGRTRKKAITVACTTSFRHAKRRRTRHLQDLHVCFASPTKPARGPEARERFRKQRTRGFSNQFALLRAFDLPMHRPNRIHIQVPFDPRPFHPSTVHQARNDQFEMWNTCMQ